MSSKKVVKQSDAELAPFANNSHETEYTKMMHRYADLDKEKKHYVESNVSQTGCYS